jgi:hypothetical protein
MAHGFSGSDRNHALGCVHAKLIGRATTRDLWIPAGTGLQEAAFGRDGPGNPESGVVHAGIGLGQGVVKDPRIANLHGEGRFSVVGLEREAEVSVLQGEKDRVPIHPHIRYNDPRRKQERETGCPIWENIYRIGPVEFPFLEIQPDGKFMVQRLRFSGDGLRFTKGSGCKKENQRADEPGQSKTSARGAR